MKPPKRIDLTQEELEALLERISSRTIKEEDYEILHGMGEMIKYLSVLLEEKNISMKRLKKILFGAKTESSKNLLGEDGGDGASDDDDPDSDDKPSGSGGQKGDKKKAKTPKKGHGRNGASKFTGATKIPVSHSTLESGDPCPECPKGRVYKKPDPGVIIRLTGEAPVSAKIFELEKLRCNLCGQVFTADLPADAGDYNDDTNMKILDLMKELKQAGKGSRKGIFTTGILSCRGDVKISLFFTGRNHAGENMLKLLQQRASDLDLPVQMCDALSRNTPEGLKTILANCLTHGRRNFVDIIVSFPEKCRYVIKILAKVYANDDKTKSLKMSDEDRLKYHKTHSGPLMEELKTWLQEQFDKKHVEPNSNMGRAISYMQKHWSPLTLFLRRGDAPLDNNLCEQILKRAILHRKNSLFYKTEHGAFIGDLFMGLIQTCKLNAANPYHYLKTLYQHSSEVFQNPHLWMPWNYEEQLVPAP